MVPDYLEASIAHMIGHGKQRVQSRRLHDITKKAQTQHERDLLDWLI
jgi:hypothetical protein